MSINPSMDRYFNEVIRDRFNTQGVNSIADFLGIHWTTVYKRAKRMGMVCVGNERKANRSISCDIHYFDKWSSNMAYILGFLYADGSVSSCSTIIDVARPDEVILNFIKDEIKVKTPIKRYHYPKSKTGPFSRLCFNSTVLVRRLAELGLLPRKTFCDYPYVPVPDKFLGSFVRGYFDGDGSVSHPTQSSTDIRMIGSPKFILGLIQSLVDVGKMSYKEPQKITGKKSSWSVVSWTHPNDLRLFYRLAYPDNGYSFCLERKRSRLYEWLMKPRIEMKVNESNAESLGFPIPLTLGDWRKLKCQRT
ncbi:MAG: hypothetical protein KGL39_12565 [Patescibacteria group bacterium]|nr:hypothetical protein [Patescibacteria group bacterium]